MFIIVKSKVFLEDNEVNNLMRCKNPQAVILESDNIKIYIMGCIFLFLQLILISFTLLSILPKVKPTKGKLFT